MVVIIASLRVIGTGATTAPEDPHAQDERFLRGSATDRARRIATQNQNRSHPMPQALHRTELYACLPPEALV